MTNGIYCGDQSGYRDPRRPVLEKGAADWQFLLQIDSDEERLGWMWGDAGRSIYFMSDRGGAEKRSLRFSIECRKCQPRSTRGRGTIAHCYCGSLRGQISFVSAHLVGDTTL